MFTGIVEETGELVAFGAAPSGPSWQLEIAARRALEDLAIGDSIAVNGCCLTATRAGPASLHFDLLEETRRLTSFSQLKAGSRVNLERSLRLGGKMGGHFVTGHIDAVGLIEVFEPRGADHYLRVRVPAPCSRYVISKGSIAIDGVSLTVAEAGADALAVWLIPHTLAMTALGDKRAGDQVNLEFDLLGKYVEKLLPGRAG
jgi:riboflavin synthase